MLNIKDLVISVEGKTVIKNLNLKMNKGEVHAIMGPNGSGKSTLANTLARNPAYIVESGSIEFKGKNVLDMEPEECARDGMFLSFQYPVAIPGVSNVQFIKTAVNAVRKHQNKPTYDAVEFLQLVKEKMASLNMDQDFLYRAVNEGFSGGEKKRNEILQMLLLEPKLAILDETDSGLDVDALKDVANGVNLYRGPERSILLITHYQRLLDYVTPDFVHIMIDGNLIYSGDKTLPHEIEVKGYNWIKEQAAH
ncbi:MAG TPA: Fe-S cluster assembly ATPase SufC [Gammaproteobacteria bacterium]|nr:Fe-S cluster assembly ATPase SufC [Gammaproteobacteria bacterium]